MDVPINRLQQGEFLSNRHLISADRVRMFRFAAECDDVGGGIMPGSRFKIAEVHARPGGDWVKLVIPGSDPPRTLKIAGGELAHLFDRAR